ncbi:MAG: hypothetical protein WCI22_14610 [Actinomycetota bacterium]
MSHRLLALACLSVVAVACTEAAPSSSVVPVPVTTDAGTLLPVVTDNTTPDTTVPAHAIFGGEVCTALTAGDLSSTSFRGFGTGPLMSTDSPSSDSCQYTVGSDTNTVVVLVRLISPDDFSAPPSSNDLSSPVAGVGIAARSINHGSTVEVQVQVPNGWFAVTTPDLASAQRLAERAVPRATPNAG